MLDAPLLFVRLRERAYSAITTPLRKREFSTMQACRLRGAGAGAWWALMLDAPPPLREA